MTRVLVVDDNPANRALLQFLFSRLGAEVTSARDAATAVEAAGRLRPDVVVVDVFLPGPSGHDTAEALRRLPGLEGVPMVAVSAGDPVDAEVGLPFSAFYRLPVDVDSFAQSVLGHLGSR